MGKYNKSISEIDTSQIKGSQSGGNGENGGGGNGSDLASEIGIVCFDSSNVKKTFINIASNFTVIVVDVPVCLVKRNLSEANEGRNLSMAEAAVEVYYSDLSSKNVLSGNIDRSLRTLMQSYDPETNPSYFNTFQEHYGNMAYIRGFDCTHIISEELAEVLGVYTSSNFEEIDFLTTGATAFGLAHGEGFVEWAKTNFNWRG